MGSGESVGFGVNETRERLLVLPITDCVTLGQLLSLTEPQLPHVKMKIKDLLWGIG